MSATLHKVNATIRKLPTWPLYVAGGLLPAWYFYLGLTGGLGAEPVKGLERVLGELGLQALIATLLVTPLRRLTGVNLILFRRALGLLTFYYVFCHLLVWLLLDIAAPSQIWSDILKRPYITVGMLGFVVMVPLAATSNAYSMRNMGPVRWRRLHMLTYVACALGAVHYVLLAKGWQLEPLVYLAIVTVLLATRLPIVRRLAPV